MAKSGKVPQLSACPKSRPLLDYPSLPGRNPFSNTMFKILRGLFSNDLSIDLGTANTLIYVRALFPRLRSVVAGWNVPAPTSMS